VRFPFLLHRCSCSRQVAQGGGQDASTAGHEENDGDGDEHGAMS
jgi:hypothetical protein